MSTGRIFAPPLRSSPCEAPPPPPGLLSRAAATAEELSCRLLVVLLLARLQVAAGIDDDGWVSCVHCAATELKAAREGSVLPPCAHRLLLPVATLEHRPLNRSPQSALNSLPCTIFNKLDSGGRHKASTDSDVALCALRERAAVPNIANDVARDSDGSAMGVAYTDMELFFLKGS